MAASTRLELAIFAVTGRRGLQLPYEAICALRRQILKARRMVILQPYAYTTQIRKIPLPESQAKTFYTDLNHSRTNLMSETYLTLPCLPSRSIGPEPFQYLNKYRWRNSIDRNLFA